jgi:hypothetical protein
MESLIAKCIMNTNQCCNSLYSPLRTTSAIILNKADGCDSEHEA